MVRVIHCKKGWVVLTRLWSPQLHLSAQDRRRKGPGFHCLHMRLIAVEFHPHHRPSINICTLMMSKPILNVMWTVCLHIIVPNVAYIMRNLDCALWNALLLLALMKWYLNRSSNLQLWNLCVAAYQLGLGSTFSLECVIIPCWFPLSGCRWPNVGVTFASRCFCLFW